MRHKRHLHALGIGIVSILAVTLGLALGVVGSPAASQTPVVLEMVHSSGGSVPTDNCAVTLSGTKRVLLCGDSTQAKGFNDGNWIYWAVQSAVDPAGATLTVNWTAADGTAESVSFVGTASFDAQRDVLDVRSGPNLVGQFEIWDNYTSES